MPPRSPNGAGRDAAARQQASATRSASPGCSPPRSPRPPQTPRSTRPQDPLAPYRCPSDTADDHITGTDNNTRVFGDGPGGQYHAPTANYLGSLGLYNQATNNNGVLFAGSAIGFRDIADGTSNVFAVGERDNQCWQGPGTWLGAPDLSMTSSGIYHAVGNVRWPINDPTPAQCREGFGSLHPGGAMFLFCDGSVHFLSETITSNRDSGDSSYDRTKIGLYQQLGIRDDGMPLRGEW